MSTLAAGIALALPAAAPADRAGLIHGTYLATMRITDSLNRSPLKAPVAWVKLRGS